MTTINKDDIVSEYPHSDSGRKNAKIIKVKKWSEFFDFDEFENGMEHMKKPIEQVTELSEEEGSDSEPSVDNYNQKELGEFLGAALDLKVGEANPFDEPEISVKSEKCSKKSSDGLEEMIDDSC